jgi:hypothetical protein
MTEHFKNIYTLNTKGERKLADLVGQNKNEIYIDHVMDLENAKDHNEPAMVLYGERVVFFDDSDFDVAIATK